MDDGNADQGLPENPQQEAALLSFPETGNHIVGRKVPGGVAVGVVVFKVVVVDDIKQGHEHACHGNGMGIKGYAGIDGPGMFGLHIVGGP